MRACQTFFMDCERWLHYCVSIKWVACTLEKLVPVSIHWWHSICIICHSCSIQAPKHLCKKNDCLSIGTKACKFLVIQVHTLHPLTMLCSSCPGLKCIYLLCIHYSSQARWKTKFNHLALDVCMKSAMCYAVSEVNAYDYLPRLRPISSGLPSSWIQELYLRRIRRLYSINFLHIHNQRVTGL